MKKILFIGVIMALALSGCENIIYNEWNPKDTDVIGARGSRDGTYVRISGTIENRLGGFNSEYYNFYDSTGTIVVEIDDDVWIRSIGVHPNSLQLPAPFEIVGEVDKDRGQNPMIDVDRLTRL